MTISNTTSHTDKPPDPIGGCDPERGFARPRRGLGFSRFGSAILAAFIAVAVASSASFAPAQEQQRRQGAPGQQRAQQQQPQQPSGPGVLRLLPQDSVTEHSIDTALGRIDYTATAGTLSLFDQSGERSAEIFYTAYVAKGADKTRRPLTFVFNGGPGAASAYLHLGLVGPRIVDFGPGNRDAASARLQDNRDTWLGFTDLVMLDPVGTGWSRAAKPDGANAFWGVQNDANSLAKAIALYLSNNGRSGSPKYLLGESYGGFRAVKLAQALRHEQGIAVAGIMMLSPLVEGALTFSGTRFALGAALQLPSLAASELERRGTFSTQKLAEAERFALTDYLTTLAGPPPQGEAARTFYARIADLTGLPEDVVARSRGFIRDAYVKNLRSSDHKVVSRYDATFATDDPYPEQQTARGPDPLLDGLTRVYGGIFANYARDELGFKTEMTYILLGGEISGKWDWGGRAGRGNASVADDMRELLALDPSFRLVIAHGYSDMVTPYAASRYVLDHLPPIGDPSRAQLRTYRGGHMFYIDADSRRAFTKDAKAFYDIDP
jgi:carboxypeptidase C (cathepsin A)